VLAPGSYALWAEKDGYMKTEYNEVEIIDTDKPEAINVDLTLKKSFTNEELLKVILELIYEQHG
jgi:hypothetical protein